MIEAVVINYLNDVLDVPAYMERPERPPKRYVLVEKAGSGGDKHIRTANMIIQSYAERLTEAAKLNEQVKAALDELPLIDEVCRSECNSDYNYTDAVNKVYRYQAVYTITYY